MLPDHLLGFVALDAARPFVPAHHTTARIEHEDAVVLHALNEDAESFLTRAQRVLGAATGREVSSDLCKTDELAVRIPEGGDDDAGPEACAIFP